MCLTSRWKPRLIAKATSSSANKMSSKPYPPFEGATKVSDIKFKLDNGQVLTPANHNLRIIPSVGVQDGDPKPDSQPVGPSIPAGSNVRGSGK